MGSTLQDTARLTWDDILNHDKIVGGDIESTSFGILAWGPVSEVRRQGETILFVSPWIAGRSAEGSGWKINDVGNKVTSLNMTICEPPQDRRRGCLEGQMVGTGDSYKLFLVGGEKLDPRRVKGLPPASERLLALYPELALDRALAEKVLHDAAFSPLMQGLPESATFRDLFAKFRNDSSAEDFLCRYIEASIPGENAFTKVY